MSAQSQTGRHQVWLLSSLSHLLSFSPIAQYSCLRPSCLSLFIALFCAFAKLREPSCLTMGPAALYFHMKQMENVWHWKTEFNLKVSCNVAVSVSVRETESKGRYGRYAPPHHWLISMLQVSSSQVCGTICNKAAKFSSIWAWLESMRWRIMLWIKDARRYITVYILKQHQQSYFTWNSVSNCLSCYPVCWCFPIPQMFLWTFSSLLSPPTLLLPFVTLCSQ